MGCIFQQAGRIRANVNTMSSRLAAELLLNLSLDEKNVRTLPAPIVSSK